MTGEVVVRLTRGAAVGLLEALERDLEDTARLVPGERGGVEALAELRQALAESLRGRSGLQAGTCFGEGHPPRGRHLPDHRARMALALAEIRASLSRLRPELERLERLAADAELF